MGFFVFPLLLLFLVIFYNFRLWLVHFPLSIPFYNHKYDFRHTTLFQASFVYPLFSAYPLVPYSASSGPVQQYLFSNFFYLDFAPRKVNCREPTLNYYFFYNFHFINNFFFAHSFTGGSLFSPSSLYIFFYGFSNNIFQFSIPLFPLYGRTDIREVFSYSKYKIFSSSIFFYLSFLHFFRTLEGVAEWSKATDCKSVQ